MTIDFNSSRWTARDGKELPFVQWPGAPESPKAVVVCVHGLSGAASDFWPAGESLPKAGHAVYGMQLRGQGNDPDVKARGDIQSETQWIHDLIDFSALVKRRHPGAPVYWYGESLGALITIHAATLKRDRDVDVSGIILSSPVVALRENLTLPFFKNLAVRTVLYLFPGKRISLEALGNSEVQVTSGTTHRQQMQHTPHYVPAFTLRLFGRVEQLIRRSPEAAERVEVPVLIFYTPNDALVSAEGVEAFFDRLASKDKTLRFFPRSYHLILHDVDRGEALEALREWLDKRAPAAREREKRMEKSRRGRRED